MKTNWDQRFLDLAEYISGWSKDTSSKVGAVIVRNRRIVSTGYNGFPEGYDDNDPKNHERPLKYALVNHAEENAIINAARIGNSTEGTTMYLNWFPCGSCAGDIVNAGITKIICGTDFDFEHERWGDDFKIAIMKLYHGGVEVETPKYLIANYGVFITDKITQIEVDGKLYGWVVPNITDAMITGSNEDRQKNV
jgi:dCMP deaminase